MATIESIIDDYFPATDTVGVPLNSVIFVLFEKEMNESELEEKFFIEGPDTDSFVGPGFEIGLINVSQGDDFLSSPGYSGVVGGTVSFQKIHLTNNTIVTESPYRTKLIFTPSKPLVKLTNYTAHIPEATDNEGVSYTGYYTFNWTTGSGSITALPSTSSSSVLVSGSRTIDTSTSFLVVEKTLPLDQSVEINTELSQIEITFDKDLDDTMDEEGNYTVNPSSLISIKSSPATDHPAATVEYLENIAKLIEISGKKLIIKI